MKNKYLPLYYRWMKTGKLPNQNGLCGELGRTQSGNWSFEENPLFLLLMPDNANTWYYWAGGTGVSFNPLRQNIVLLMAAMNGEKL